MLQLVDGSPRVETITGLNNHQRSLDAVNVMYLSLKIAVH